MSDKYEDQIREHLEKGYRLPGEGVTEGYNPVVDDAGPPPSGGSGDKQPEPKK